MKTFVPAETGKEARKTAKEARSLGNIAAMVCGGVMVFDNYDEYRTWKGQK